MSSHPEELYSQLGVAPPPPRVVLHQDGTETKSQYVRECGIAYDEDSVDALYGNTSAYVVLKKEKPEHRMILWHTLQGRRPKEIALLMRCTYQTVLNVRGQPWFKQAFVRLSSELGKDAVETMLAANEIPALQRLIDLSESAEAETTRLSATNALLDRIRGKPIVKQEIKSTSTSTVDIAVSDVSALQAEHEKNLKLLYPNGNPGSGLN